ncbi:MAG: hypothetical protein R3A52_00355 [Polyangiales bacterium]
MSEAESPRWMRVARGERAVMVFNLSAAPTEIPLGIDEGWPATVSSGGVPAAAEVVTIEGWGFAVYEREG